MKIISRLSILSRSLFIISFLLSGFTTAVLAETQSAKAVALKKKAGKKVKKDKEAPAETAPKEPAAPVTSSFTNVPIDVDVDAEHAYLIDYETGTVLLDKNGEKPMHPSSMTKIMTAYLVIDKIKKGTIKPTDRYVVGKNGYKLEGSSMFLDINDQVSVMDLLKGLIIQSGNDASVTLAENISGSEAAFAREMTRKAVELGAIATNFVNSSGLPLPDHLTTAKDLATISRHVIKDQPEYYPIYSEKEYEYNNIKQGNRNPLLYKNLGCDGIKTGHSSAGGYGMVASCVDNGHRLILVVNGLKGQQSRSNESAKLMTWGLRTFTNKTIVQPNSIIGPVPIHHGTHDVVEAYIPEGLILTVPKAQENDIQQKITLNDSVEAPVKEGDVVGHVNVTAPFLKDPIQINIIAKSSVERAGFFARLWQDLMSKIPSTPKDKAPNQK